MNPLNLNDGELNLDEDHHRLTFQTETFKLALDLQSLFAVRFTNFDSIPNHVKLKGMVNFTLPDDPTTSTTRFTLFHFERSTNASKLMTHTFKAKSSNEAKFWVDRIRLYLSLNWKRKVPKLIIVVNPSGGGKEALTLFERVTQPMLKLAGIVSDLFVTQYPKHATAIINKVPNLRSYDAMVAIGGDGILNEVVNGALTRSDWEEVIKVPLGILPAGSGNGVAASLNIIEFHMATLNLIRLNVCRYDICALYCPNLGDRITYSLLDTAVGYLSDVDQFADKLRWLGPFRLYAAAFIKAIWLKAYRTRIHYLPAGKSMGNCCKGKHGGAHTVLEVDPIAQGVKPGPIPQIPNLLRGYGGTESSIRDQLTLDWVVVDGALSVTAITNVPFITKDLRLSSLASPSDGRVTLVHEKPPLSGLRLLYALLQEVVHPNQNKFLANLRETQAACVIVESLGEASGPSMNLAITQPSPTSMEQPIPFNPNQPGTFRVDGEVLEGTQAIQVQVMPGLLNLICPIW